jgi:hypothetical protein
MWGKACIHTDSTELKKQWIPTAINLGFLDRSHYYFYSSSPSEWTLFQTYYFSENLVPPGIEPRTFGSVAGNSGH